jgi:hypothetical protein
LDDKFLYQQRPPIRTGFAESLYRRIESQKEDRPLRKRNLSGIIWKFALIASLILAILFTFSAPTRAAVVDLLERIAGFNVNEVETVPTFPPNATITVYDNYTPQPLAASLPNLPFTFNMPAYIPDGFNLSDEVVIAQSKDWVALKWVGNGQEIGMFVQQNWDLSLDTAQGVAEEVQINGEPALLLRGGWSLDESGKWDSSLNVFQLYWRHDGLIYTFDFRNLPPGGDQETYIQEIIRVASSIP